MTNPNDEANESVEPAPKRRIGVYVCHCGGNISDYVDVPKVVEAVQGEADVVIAREAMFTCSDATQQQIVDDIEALHLDGMVVASCSPKLHLETFRGAARRGELNPYEYTQVNIREQCSWTHTDDREGATEKASRLVLSGIARTRLSVPLEPVSVETTRAVLVLGGGVAGMRAAVALADLGLEVFLVEREQQLGGHAATLGELYPNAANGHELVERLRKEIDARQAVTVFTGTEVAGKSGTYGNYQVKLRSLDEELSVEVGQIIVATGFDSYEPPVGRFGYGEAGVITLDEFKRMLDSGDGPLSVDGKKVNSIAYIYCVGSRDEEHPYCSRYCCTATVHASVLAARRDPTLHQYHLYRDMRTYGRNELIYNESRRRRSLFLKFADDDPPQVASANGKLTVTVNDVLTGNERLEIPADLVVLVTAMVPPSNDDLIATLKIPVGRDGFFNEIHPKLRPVETVVDGLSICGACQGPKSVAESTASALAAASHAAGVLKRGVVELDPEVAVVDEARCDACGDCIPACPFEAISLSGNGGKAAVIDPTACKGCGGCVPVCPKDAIDLMGYTDAQIRAMLDALTAEVVV